MEGLIAVMVVGLGMLVSLMVALGIAFAMGWISSRLVEQLNLFKARPARIKNEQLVAALRAMGGM